MLIEARHLSYTYMPGTPFQIQALKDINLTVHKGEFVGVIGETGSGKTTLIQHFNGLLKPTEGELLVNGENVWTEGTGLRQLRSRIALLFQFPEHQLFEETVFKDIAFGPRNMGLEGSEVEKRVRYSMELMGLKYSLYKDRSPFSLSGGEKRRTAMAGIMAMDPEVIILDEPAAGMDPLGRRKFMEKICMLHRDEKITVILVTHNMEEVSRLADRLFVLSQGKMVLEGKPSLVFNSPDTIREAGLDIPSLTYLLTRMRESGKEIRTDIFTVEEAGEEILRFCGEANR